MAYKKLPCFTKLVGDGGCCGRLVRRLVRRRLRRRLRRRRRRVKDAWRLLRQQNPPLYFRRGGRLKLVRLRLWLRLQRGRVRGGFARQVLRRRPRSRHTRPKVASGGEGKSRGQQEQ